MTERLLRLEEDLLKAQSEVSKTTMETLETSPRSPPPESVADMPGPISRAPWEQNKTHRVSYPAGTNTGGAANAAVREKAHYKSLLARFTYLRVLHDFIASDLGHYLNLQASINDGALGAIRFQDLWYLFQLRDCLDQFHTLSKNPIFSSGTWTSFIIDCYYMGCDGDFIGPVDSRKVIQCFSGSAKIQDLPIYPIQFHVARDEILAKLTARGRRAVSIYGHMSYNGPVARCTRLSYREDISGDIFIDATTYYRGTATPKPRLGSLLFSRYWCQSVTWNFHPVAHQCSQNIWNAHPAFGTHK